MLRVGVIGCGAIGSELALAVAAGDAGDATLAGVFDLDTGAALKLAKAAGCTAAGSLAELLVNRPDVVVEAASQEAVRSFGESVVLAGPDIVVLSVGALLDSELMARLEAACRKTGARVRVPSGAVLAVDALKAAKLGGIKSVTLTTRKPPEALGLAREELAGNERVLFDGPAAQAVKKFPRNVNVAATISLAGIGPERTRVRLIADPNVKRNTHELSVEAESGSILARTENAASENPRTSRLAALSAIRLIRDLGEPVIIGT